MDGLVVLEFLYEGGRELSAVMVDLLEGLAFLFWLYPIHLLDLFYFLLFFSLLLQLVLFYCFGDQFIFPLSDLVDFLLPVLFLLSFFHQKVFDFVLLFWVVFLEQYLLFRLNTVIILSDVLDVSVDFVNVVIDLTDFG
jgi:hypothetical protein